MAHGRTLRELMDINRFQIDKLRIEIHPSSEAAARAAAQKAAQLLRQLAAERDNIAAIFATGASQLEMLRAMVGDCDVPWNRIDGFHLDEYIGLNANHPASFRRYLRDNLTGRVRMRSFHEIEGDSPDPASVCRQYAEGLRGADPQLCLLGIGENGHLAFNDPGEADFNDPDDMKIVALDETCRQQQAAEGWFATPEDVPSRALTVTIPALFRVAHLVVTVPGTRKAQMVRRTLYGAVSPDCPATILRLHRSATLYLDFESASELNQTSELRTQA